METIDVCVIGAGPAGLFTGFHSAKPGLKIYIIERNNEAGKKLLLSGSNQCNITHSGPVADFLPYYGGKGRFIKPALFHFTNRDLVSFFEKRGCGFVTLPNGKVFPRSFKAHDIRKVLIDTCHEANIRLCYGKCVRRVVQEQDGFFIKGDCFTLQAKVIVLATGGMSYPETGSTGDGYSLAASLGHGLVTPRPALTSIVVENYPFADLSGISLKDASFSLWRNNRQIVKASGDLLFTHSGLSGPAVLDNSRYIEPGDTVLLNSIPFLTPFELENYLISPGAGSGRKSIQLFLHSTGLPKRFVERVLELIQVPAGTTLATLNKQMRKQVMSAFTAFPLIISRTGGFKTAMVTAGGIPVAEINRNTMESRKVPGLFFAGEIIDIDGDTGGYNLQAAFSTGALAGHHIYTMIGGLPGKPE
ncbi:MAG: NAD(P)/FAD-dependent oxidoreductase [Spirochaetales bacterium]|nr:NAD(P)/FAD-dependent oxidoreductase [Spirochaetales bacterium]